MIYDLIVIGGGPAGYVAALRAGQLGLKAALIEREKVGGLCLTWGCIPTKALIESARLFQRMGQASQWGIGGFDPSVLRFHWPVAVQRALGIAAGLGKDIEARLRKHGVELIQGEATILASGSVQVDGRSLATRAILIATGSRIDTTHLPLPRERVWTPRELLRQSGLPETLAIYGQGGNAVELAQLLRLTGHEVALLCPEERLLPEFDPILEDALAARLVRDGVRIEGDISLDGYEDGQVCSGALRIPAEAIVIATQRKAVLPASHVALKTQEGFLCTDASLQTSVPGIFAAGDVTGRASLAHAASAQGLFVVNRLKGHRTPWELDHYPLTVYAIPEAAQIGATEARLRSRGIPFKASLFPMSANGKALAEGQAEGFVRILSDPATGRVLGVQILADQAADLIAEAAVLMRMEGTVFDLAGTAHAHPTVSEVFLEASLAATRPATR